MTEYSKLFPFEKAVVLNVLYDALDAVVCRIDKSNHIRGVLLVSSVSAPNKKVRIVLSPGLGEKTLVEIFSLDAEGEQDERITALLAEMDALIKKAGMGEMK